MQVTLRHRESITLDLNVRQVIWALASARQVGTAQIDVPRESAAFDPRYIADDGGTFIVIEHAQLGRWLGVTIGTNYDESGVTLSAVHIAALVSKRIVSKRDYLSPVSAGVIVKDAVLDALTGLPQFPVRPGSFLEAPPVVDGYSLNYNQLSAVLTDLMGRSGHEWGIDETGAFNWVARIGQPRAGFYVQNRDLFDVQYQSSLDETVYEVIALPPDGSPFRVSSTDVLTANHWAAQKVLQLSQGDDYWVVQNAAQTLERSRYPRVTISARLHRRHWSTIREGDSMRWVLPSSGIQGKSVAVRVIQRAASDGAEYEDLTVEVLPSITTANTILGSEQRTIARPFAASSVTTNPIQQVAASQVKTVTTTTEAAQKGTDSTQKPVFDYHVYMNDLTVTNSLGVGNNTNTALCDFDYVQVDRDLNVDGNFTVGGTKSARVADDSGTVLFFAEEGEQAYFFQRVPLPAAMATLADDDLMPVLMSHLDGRFLRSIDPPLALRRESVYGRDGRRIGTVAVVTGAARADLSCQGPKFGQG